MIDTLRHVKGVTSSLSSCQPGVGVPVRHTLPVMPATTPVPSSIAGRRVLLRRAEPDDRPALAAMYATPEVLRWWGREPLDDPDYLSGHLTDEQTAYFAVLLDGAVAGAIEYHEETTPDFRHAGIDVALHPRWHGQGLGTDTVGTLARWLVTAGGHHRLTIDPAAANTAAVRCYRRVGFQPVGVMRRYWRDPSGVWQDGLLMDALAEEVLAATS
jgi:aminoglycoside 6'-N-acetyltransferase